MEGVIQALKRARAGSDVPPQASLVAKDASSTRPSSLGAQVTLDRSTLISNRIVSFDSVNPPTRAYDMLRNIVLDDLATSDSRTIAVTSPTRRCGVTVTAANLAFSIARLRTTKVMLFDCSPGAQRIPEVFRSNSDLEPAGADGDAGISLVNVDGIELYVGSVASMAKSSPSTGVGQAVTASLRQIKQQLGPVNIVLDLPPMLTGDETIPLLLSADMVLLVLAVGHSTIQDLEACKTYLNDDGRVQVVLNKARKHGL